MCEYSALGGAMTSDEFFLDQLNKNIARANAYGEAISALLLAGGVKSYTLDTTQGKQTVAREDVDKLQETYFKLMDWIDAAYVRLEGSVMTQVIPVRAFPWGS